MAELAEITAANKTLTSGPSWPPLTTAIADGGMIMMTVSLIVVGAYRSVPPSAKSEEELKEKLKTWHPRGETFVHVASLFVLIFKVFLDDEHSYLRVVNNFFFLLGCLCSLTPLLSSLVTLLMPISVPKFQFRFTWWGFICTLRFSLNFLISVVSSSAICLWYLLKRHWIANNILGFAFCVRGIELLKYTDVLSGFKLLGCLLIGEIFQEVFGMDSTMVIPKSYNSPIQLIFPLENGIGVSGFIMLRFHEIVIPGIFIAHLLRFDKSLMRKSNYYFISTTAAYTFGLLATYLEMHYYCQTKSALLFLLPACLGTPVLLSFVMRDFKAMCSYKDHPTAESDLSSWFRFFTSQQGKNEENLPFESHSLKEH